MPDRTHTPGQSGSLRNAQGPDLDLARRIRDACAALGFARCGVATIAPASRPEALLDWLAQGKHGDMSFMTERLELRLDSSRLFPSARSVIIVADQYAPRGDQPGALKPLTASIARYARGKDYHRVIKDRLHQLADKLRSLFPDAEFRTFVDTAPVLEREHAERALPAAFIGKHTLLIDPRLGSFLLLGGIATSLELAGAHTPETSAVRTDHCGSCTQCIDACPTTAITPFSVDASRCVSYLTIEHRGRVDPSLHNGIGDRLLGCDVCQDVCPFNSPIESGHFGGPYEPSRVHPAYLDLDHRRAQLPILDVLRWNAEDRARVLAQSAAKRATLDMLRRNAIINAGNALVGSAASPNPAEADTHQQLRSLIDWLANDPEQPELIRQTAHDVLTRISSNQPPAR